MTEETRATVGAQRNKKKEMTSVFGTMSYKNLNYLIRLNRVRVDKVTVAEAVTPPAFMEHRSPSDKCPLTS
jgi:hypothetical protein